MTIQASPLSIELAERVPTSAMTEAHIVQGYSRATLPDSVSRPCACGGVIVALSGSDPDVTRAVLNHVRSDAHDAWSVSWRAG